VGQAAPTHPVTDQGALILSDGSTNLQQQLVVRVLSQGPLEELDGAAVPMQFLHEQDLVYILVGQSVRCGHHHAIELGERRPVTQLIEPWSAQTRSAVAGIAEDGVLIHSFSLAGDVRPQPFQLLLDGLRLGLSAG